MCFDALDNNTGGEPQPPASTPGQHCCDQGSKRKSADGDDTHLAPLTGSPPTRHTARGTDCTRFRRPLGTDRSVFRSSYLSHGSLRLRLGRLLRYRVYPFSAKKNGSGLFAGRRGRQKKNTPFVCFERKKTNGGFLYSIPGHVFFCLFIGFLQFQFPFETKKQKKTENDPQKEKEKKKKRVRLFAGVFYFRWSS